MTPATSAMMDDLRSLTLPRILALAPRCIIYIFLIWGVTLFASRVVFHPLRKYPGPLLAKLTDGYAGFHAAGRRPHLNVYQNLQTYGPVYRAGPNRLVFNSLTAVQDIYFNPGVTKGKAYRSTRPNEPPNLLEEVNKTEHRRKRNAIAPIISPRSLGTFEPIMSAQINIFLQKLLRASETSDVVNASVNCKRLAVDVVGFLSFGHELDTQSTATNRFIIDTITKLLYGVGIFYNWPSIGFISPIVRQLRKKSAQKVYSAIMGMINARKALPKDAKADFYSVAVSNEKAGVGLYESELRTEAVVFIIAGGTTVATAMSSTLFYLARHPAAYNRLAAEIRENFSSGEDICAGQKLSDCKYLRAVIDEAIRMSPPSLTTLWREADPASTKPFVVDGHDIPRGTQVAVHLYSILHNPEYYPEPFLFRPERWLEPEAESDTPEKQEQRKIMRRAQANFGFGDRSCPGKSMAYMEISIAIARILWYFDFESAPGLEGKLGEGIEGSRDRWTQPDQFQLDDIFVADHDGPNLVFKRRGEYWRELEKET